MAPTQFETIPELSFGIELEGLLIFTDDLLQSVLPPGWTINKTATNKFGKRLDKQHFPGWAMEDGGEENTFLRYNNEPQRMAARLVDAMDMSSSEDEADDSSTTDSSRQLGRVDHSDERLETSSIWTIARDASVKKWDEEQKRAVGLDPARFDTADIEFISEVCTDVKNLKSEVESLVQKLTKRECGVVNTERSGFHVHVGRTNDDRIPLEVLRVLMFVLLVFEPEISKLHEPHRAASLRSDDWIRSNLRHHMATKSTHSRDFKNVRRLNGNIEHYRSKYRSISELRREIFRTDFEDKKAAFRHLKALGGDGKGFVVNWQNIDGENIFYYTSGGVRHFDYRTDRAPTIEFRQHAGTFDAQQIGHWVQFCLAVVRWSWEHAHSGEVLPKIKTWEDVGSITDLLTMLELDDETAHHFRTKKDAAEASMGLTSFQLWEDCDMFGDVDGQPETKWRYADEEH